MVERNAGTRETKRIVHRIGVNLGDVLIEGDGLANALQPRRDVDAIAENVWAQPKSFSRPMPPPTTLSTSNAISRQLNLTTCFAPRR